MNTKQLIGNSITAVAILLLAGTAQATEHAPTGVTAEALANVSRLVESLGNRVDALEKQNRALEADLDSMRAKDRALESTNQELGRKLGVLTIPDVAPFRASLSAMQANVEIQSGVISTMSKKTADLETALSMLGAQADVLKSADLAMSKRLDTLKLPDLAPVEARLDALHADVEKQERVIATANKSIASQDSAIELIKTTTASLAAADSALEKRVAGFEVPDISPLEAELSALRSADAKRDQAITALEGKHAAMASRIADLQSASASLIDQNALLAKRMDDFSVPDLAPLVADLEAVKAVNEDQSKIIDRLVSKEEALMVAATGLQSQIDNIALPDLATLEQTVSALDTRQAAVESAVGSLKSTVDDHQSALLELAEKDNALMVAATGLQSQIDRLDIPDLAAMEAEVTSLKSRADALGKADETMQAQMDNLIALNVPQLSVDVQSLTERLAGVTRNGDTLKFDAMNIQLTSGGGATDAKVNGLGNLIIGYDEKITPFLEGDKPESEKSGSHNLIVGKGHNYAGYGGIVAGRDNVVAGNYGMAAGTRNQALGDFSSVTGGQLNTAAGWYASVSGGFRNLASENSASVSGGQLNVAAGAASSVGGGFQVRAQGNSNWAAGRLFQRQ